jgi:hypothetical protein
VLPLGRFANRPYRVRRVYLRFEPRRVRRASVYLRFMNHPCRLRRASVYLRFMLNDNRFGALRHKWCARLIARHANGG